MSTKQGLEKKSIHAVVGMFDVDSRFYPSSVDGVWEQHRNVAVVEQFYK